MEENINKKKIAVIGKKEFTLGFELAGIQKTYNHNNQEEYKEQIQELITNTDEEIGILIVNEKDLEETSKRIQQEVNQSVDPVTVILSEEGENQRLQEKIKKAIGADITQ